MTAKPSSPMSGMPSPAATEERPSPNRHTNIASATGAGSARGSISPLRQRTLGRSSTLADVGSPSYRRSSLFSSESVDEARQSIKSSTDDLLLPKAKGPDFESHHDPSHWHSIPLAVALLPAIGGLFFTNGSQIITDITLLGLAAVFLNWSVRLPWDWYVSTQAIRLRGSEVPDDYPLSSSTVIEEEDEEEGLENANSEQQGSGSPPKGNGNPGRPSASQHSRDAESELKKHEITALASCLVLPLVGAWMLHAIRSQLSRPSEGLVSNYNLTIFLLASELRPLSHLIKMVQARTLHLQRLVNSNPYERERVDKDRVTDLSKRLDELETHVADKSLVNASSGTTVTPPNTNQISTEVRKNLQPDLDALNRAVRRYEKRATILTIQTESRLQDLESRMADAIALAAAAERSNSSKRTPALILLDWASAAVVIPVQTAWTIVTFPAQLASTALGIVEGYITGKVRRELKTAGRVSNGHTRSGGSRSQGRGSKKAS